MAESLLLGLFPEVTSAAEAIERLRELGMTDGQITVMSAMPYRPTMLSRPPIRRRLGKVAFSGALFGVALALFLTAGIFLLYPLIVGGQPLIPFPPSLIILFEVTMLGTMWITFGGFLVVNRMPTFGHPAYDTAVTQGYVGVEVRARQDLAEQAEQILKESGASDVQRLDAERREEPAVWAFWVSIAGVVVAVLTVISVLFFYDVLRIPFRTQMKDQVVTGYEQGPRLAAPAAAVPIQGSELIAGQPATNPLAATADSLQRGKVLYGYTCVVCHGPVGAGDGRLSGFFTPKPADLTSDRVQAFSDDTIFLVITQGRGRMPSLRENLDVGDRWDVIAFVRSLKKP